MLSLEPLESSLGLGGQAARILQGRFLQGQSFEALSRREGLTRERVRRLLHREMLRGKHILSRFPDWMGIVRQARLLMDQVASLEELAKRLTLPAREQRRLRFLLRFFCELSFRQAPPPSPPSPQEVRSVILAATRELRLGTTNLTAVLRGQRWRILERFWHHSSYGKLALCSLAEVRSQIDQLVQEGELLRLPWKAYGKSGHVLTRPVQRGLPGETPKAPSADGQEAVPAPGG